MGTHSRGVAHLVSVGGLSRLCSYVLMVTYRSAHNGREQFTETLNELKDTLILNEFAVDKEIVEFAIWDTKVTHDAEWINS